MADSSTRWQRPAEVDCNIRKNLLKHGCSETPGVGVISAAMVAVEQAKYPAQVVLRAVREGMIGKPQAESAQHCLVGYGAQRQDSPRR
jgi:hypothetical protein